VGGLIAGRERAASTGLSARARTLRVSFFGIPAHPILNDLPGSLLPVASVCDLLYLARRDRSWAAAGYRLLQLGNFSALLAAVFGLLDFLRLPATPAARRLARRHAALNAIVLPLFGLCQLQRRARPDRPSKGAIGLLLAANLGLNVSAWHGARLVHAHGVRAGEPEPVVPVGLVAEPVTWGATGHTSGPAHDGPIHER
jgi:uncharacterized membrane protein